MAPSSKAVIKSREEAVARVAYKASDVVYSIESWAGSGGRSDDTSAKFAPTLADLDRGNKSKVSARDIYMMG